MAENADIQAGTPADTDSADQQAKPSTRESSKRSEQDFRTEGDDYPKVPKSRYDEMSKRAQDAERQLKKIERDQAQREEEQAQKQGEWQQVADKRQKKIDSLNNRVQELENQIVRDKRFRAWTQSATGTIRADAIGAAFEQVTDDEWQTVNEEDENSVRMLAQGLAERQPWFAGGPIGAGSGGSSRPVLGLASNNGGNANIQDNRTKTLSSGRQAWQFKKHKKHW